MKKVIVTGPNGFVGNALLKSLSDQGIETIAIVKDGNENIDKIKNLNGVRIEFCQLDNIKDLPKLVRDTDIDCCIHLGWAGSFGDSRADYKLQLKNAEYSSDLIITLSEMGIKRFVGAGTLAEKDVLNYHLTDGATPNAVSIYGIAKLTTQLITKSLCSKLGIDHVWCYLCNTYGVGNSTNNFVNMVIRKFLKGERASFTPATQIYDFTYITDTANAILAAADKGLKNRSYYLGSGDPKPLKEFITEIRDCFDPKYPLYFGEIPFNGISLKKEDYSTQKLFTDTGFKAQIPFTDGIKKTIEWFKKENIL